MADRMDVSANFCPECGHPVAHAEAVAVDEEFAIQGTFEKDDACLVIEGSEMRTFKHGDGGADE